MGEDISIEINLKFNKIKFKLKKDQFGNDQFCNLFIVYINNKLIRFRCSKDTNVSDHKRSIVSAVKEILIDKGINLINYESIQINGFPSALVNEKLNNSFFLSLEDKNETFLKIFVNFLETNKFFFENHFLTLCEIESNQLKKFSNSFNPIIIKNFNLFLKTQENSFLIFEEKEKIKNVKNDNLVSGSDSGRDSNNDSLGSDSDNLDSDNADLSSVNDNLNDLSLDNLSLMELISLFSQEKYHTVKTYQLLKSCSKLNLSKLTFKKETVLLKKLKIALIKLKNERNWNILKGQFNYKGQNIICEKALINLLELIEANQVIANFSLFKVKTLKVIVILGHSTSMSLCEFQYVNLNSFLELNNNYFSFFKNGKKYNYKITDFSKNLLLANWEDINYIFQSVKNLASYPVKDENSKFYKDFPYMVTRALKDCDPNLNYYLISYYQIILLLLKYPPKTVSEMTFFSYSYLTKFSINYLFQKTLFDV